MSAMSHLSDQINPWTPSGLLSFLALKLAINREHLYIHELSLRLTSFKTE